MTENILAKLFEHNNWANLKIIEVCLTLSDEQLDAEPQSATFGSIRSTLLHFVSSQQSYLRTLTLPLEERLDPSPALAFADLEKSVSSSGEGFLALARELSTTFPKSQLQARDGYLIEPWVIMLQAINHATEHREQIKSMLTARGVTPPNIDGWNYGRFTNALIPPST